MPVVWKINGTALADLGLAQLKRTRRSLAPDSVSFVAVGEPIDNAEPAGLALGDVITITYAIDGGAAVQWFKGTVTQVPREAAPAGEMRRYEVTGPWWYLDNLIYRQRFPLKAAANPSVASPSTSRRAVAVIGQTYLGQRETNIQAMTDILDYCIGAGAGFSRGSLPAGFQMPYVSALAPTCAEAVRACTKWMPDLATRFDYTAATPVFSAVRRGAADALTVALVPQGVRRLEAVRVATAENVADLLMFPSGVLDGLTLADGDRVLLLGQTAAAENGVYYFNDAGNELLRAADADSAEELNLAAVRVAEGTYARKEFLQTETLAILGVDDVRWVESTIHSLAITPRPDLKIDHAVVELVAVDGNFAYTQARDVDPVGSTGLEFGSAVIALDNSTDPLPAGLAANWRSSLATLQYEGRLVFEAAECLLTARPGDVVNIANGLAAWKTMRAQIMQVFEDVDAGRTEWVFGPPAHLAVQDLIEIVKASRDNRFIGVSLAVLAGRRNPTAGGEESPGELPLCDRGYVQNDFAVHGGLTVGGILDVSGDAFFAYIESGDIFAGGSISGVNLTGTGTLTIPSATLTGALQAGSVAVTSGVKSITLDPVTCTLTLADGTNTITLDAVNGEIKATGGGKTISFKLSDLATGETVKARTTDWCDAGTEKTGSIIRGAGA